MRARNFSMAGAVALLACSVFALSGAMVFSSLGNTAQAGVGGTASAVSAVASAAMAQGGGSPVVVQYLLSRRENRSDTLYRVWSSGKVERVIGVDVISDKKSWEDCQVP